MASRLRLTPQWSKLSSWAPLIAKHSGTDRIAGAAPMGRASDTSRRLADSHQRLTCLSIPGSLKWSQRHAIAGSYRHRLMWQSALGNESEAAARSKLPLISKATGEIRDAPGVATGKSFGWSDSIACVRILLAARSNAQGGSQFVLHRADWGVR